MATDYKDKIRKLLALAESPVEAEAKIALLKARELMAKHKLTEVELGEAENQAVRNVLTDITCSKRRDPWVIHLSAVIGENYCCTSYRSHNSGQQTQVVGFIGLEEDVEICTAIFKSMRWTVFAQKSSGSRRNGAIILLAVLGVFATAMVMGLQWEFQRLSANIRRKTERNGGLFWLCRKR